MKIYLAIILSTVLSSPAFAACTGPAGRESQTRYDFGAHTMFFCDGDDWVEMGSGGGGDTLAALGCAQGDSVGMGASAWECIAPGAGAGSLDFYVTSATFLGAVAGTACESGYHICGWAEFFGRGFNKAKSGTSTGGWVNAANNCADWTSSSGGDYGSVMAITDGQPTVDFGSLSSRCHTARPVMCCQD